MSNPLVPVSNDLVEHVSVDPVSCRACRHRPGSLLAGATHAVQADIGAVSKSADAIKKRLAELDRGNEQVGRGGVRRSKGKGGRAFAGACSRQAGGTLLAELDRGNEQVAERGVPSGKCR